MNNIYQQINRIGDETFDLTKFKREIFVITPDRDTECGH